jgi:hypothetical protein
VPFNDLPYTHLEQLWKGIVKVDYGLASKLSDGLEYGHYTILKINDSKYKNKDNAQFDNYDELEDFPNEIVLFVMGNEFLEQMQCTVVKGYSEKVIKGLLQRSRSSRSLECKGFILEPVIGDGIGIADACLAMLQLDNEEGNQLHFSHLGIHAFTSGSQTSNITFRDPRRSVTIAFVASKDKPFTVYASSKSKTRKFSCDDIGIKIVQDLIENKEEVRSSPMTSDKALDILKGRLAKGEITLEEYKNVKRLILEDEKNSSNWI